MNQTMGEMIAALRKEKGMTQASLAQQMNVTDKAVSKWERDLSRPDIASIPKLAETLGVSVESLMQVQQERTMEKENKAGEIVSLALKGVALAMGVGVTVLSLLKAMDTDSAIRMLGIGLACGALALLQGEKKE